MSKQQQFWEALVDYQHQDQATKDKTESWLWAEYGVETTVLIVDMSGFTAHSARHGIVHYLSMIKHMQDIVSNSIANHNGKIVKFFADDCMAIFAKSIDAFNFSIALNQQCDIENTDDKFMVHLACGIDFGRVLMIDGQDCFGQAVNRASKLGEDTAKHGQIMITKEAADLFPEAINAKQQTLSISGIEIAYYSVEYSTYA